MVERFNCSISDMPAITRLVRGEDLATTITRYAGLYDHHIPQKALDHNTLVEAMREWKNTRLDLFVKMIRSHTGPNTPFDPSRLSLLDLASAGKP